MAPPHQRLHGIDPVPGQGHDRLIVEEELPGGQGIGYGGGQFGPGVLAAAAVGVEYRIAAATGRLGPIHGGIGGLQEFVRIGPVRAFLHHPDAGTHAQALTVDLEGFGERRQHRLGQRRHLAGVGRVGHQDHELVATHPRDQLPRLGHAFPQPVRGGDQQIVADRVTVGVVDGFEMVQVHVTQADAGIRGGERFGERVEQIGPVGQTRQLVVMGPVAQTRLQCSLLGDVFHQHQGVLRGSALVPDEGDVQVGPHRVPVPMRVGLLQPDTVASAGHQHPVQFPHPRFVVGVREIGHQHAAHLVGPVPEHLRERRIDFDDPARHIRQPGTDTGLREYTAHPCFAGPQLFFGGAPGRYFGGADALLLGEQPGAEGAQVSVGEGPQRCGHG